MKFEAKPDMHASIVHLPEKMVMAQTPTFRAAIIDYIDRGNTRLVFDLQALQYIDSSGLSVLISARNQVKKYSGEVVLLNPTPSVLALIELTRLHLIMEIYETEEQALIALRFDQNEKQAV
ncbi:STAS domain-containing protein [Shewanella intestini]|uniref:Anti-sigma factor antagonist n=2 Tax=Shewanellaceae TaxID=267890 RepID=A0ABS5HYG0_9GAMM|nr:STAS domain-containing protein [Shewanella intestini]MRG34611.1 anti-sigma factor antagonist [Shewanella sp. XMDDZSB0408]